MQVKITGDLYMSHKIILIGIVPASIIISFLIHWLTLLKLKTPDARLPFCRGAYLAMSFQLVLYAWVLFGVFAVQHQLWFMIPLGMTFSFMGDIFNLQFPQIKKKILEPLFFGIISFMIAQACYITALLGFLPLHKLIDKGYLYPLLILLLVVPAILFRLRVYNPDRPKNIMMGAFIYGFILGGMSAITISGAIALGGYWVIVAAGALFFLLSDAVMGETTIYGRHPAFEFQVPWMTYLIAQGLIIMGTALYLLKG